MVFKKNTALDGEALSVIGRSKEFQFPEFKVYLHNKEIDLYIEHFYQYHVERNYVDNITDKIMVSFMLPRGYYNDWILSNPDDLEMTIIIKFKEKGRKPLINRYKFIPKIDREEVGGKFGNIDSDDLNKYDLVEVKGQCISPLLLILKSVYTEGIFRDYTSDGKDAPITIENFLNTQFHQQLRNLTIFGKPLNYRFFMYEPNNKNKYNNIVIKGGTKFITLPTNMQNGSFGIYTGGLNVYFTNLHVSSTDPDTYFFYIFPLFDKERFNKENTLPKLIVIEPTNSNLVKNTVDAYYKDKLYKIVVANTDKIAKIEREKYNTITGVNVSVSENMIDDYKVNIDKFKKASINTETFSNKYQLDQNLNSFTNIENTDFDANLFRYLTKFQKYQTKFYHMHLINLNPIFLYPGMPVEYTNLVNNKLTYYKGVVHNVSFSYVVQKKVVSTDLIIGVRT